METIKSKTHDLEYIINQLFLFSKLDIGEFPFRLEQIDIGKELSSLIAGHIKEYEEKGLTISLIQNVQNVYVEIDVVQFRNVIHNVLENSVKYKIKEHAATKIACRENDTHVLITLTDNGPGVSEEAIEQLFDVFYRSDLSRKNPSKGSGLGLAITEKIIERLGGEIKAENVPDGGLAIVITLPKLKGEENVKKILIIEDDTSIAEIERDFLEIDGFETTIATDGIEGLNQASTEKFDLILLDLMLPGIDGYEICRKIRGKTEVPILMVTARIEDADKIRGLGLGADDYISKPFSPTELVARVKANLAQYERLTTGSVVRSEEVQVGPVRINRLTHRVYINNHELEFKNKEYELLLFLISNPDIVFSKEQLYERIWGMDAIGDLKTVAVHINRLREKIEKDPQNPVYIQTVWGSGYRFKI